MNFRFMLDFISDKANLSDQQVNVRNLKKSYSQIWCSLYIYTYYIIIYVYTHNGCHRFITKLPHAVGGITKCIIKSH